MSQNEAKGSVHSACYSQLLIVLLLAPQLISSLQKVNLIKICLEKLSQLIHDGGRYHIETSPLICRADQWTSFYMITTSVMKDLKEISLFYRERPSLSKGRTEASRETKEEKEEKTSYVK